MPGEEEVKQTVGCENNMERHFTATSGYLTSLSARHSSGLGSPNCPWSILAPPGQRINMTMLDFTPLNTVVSQSIVSSRLSSQISQRYQEQQNSHISSDDRCPTVVIFRESVQGSQTFDGLSDERNFKSDRWKGECISKSCDYKARKKFSYTSRSNHLEVSLLSSTNETHFLLHYQGSVFKILWTF